jgi:asparagine synthase (glutamine-hydrolysing)
VHHLLPGREAWPALLGTLEALVDEPIADSSILPTLLVSELARVHVTVALGGDGGDELFGGYGRYPAARRVADLCGWAPSAVWPALAALAGPLPTGLRGRQLGCSLRSGPRRMLARYTPYFDPAARARLLSPDARAALGASLDEPERWRLGILGDAADVVAAASRLDFLSYLPDDILAKVDRASMFHSLEVRAPWLDVRVIEFAFGRVPTRWKVDRGRTRLLERLLAERMLPGLGVGTRKQGFSIPFGAWPDRRQAREVAERTEPLREFLDPAEVARLALVPPLRSANANRLFAVLVLCLALRRLGVGR